MAETNGSAVFWRSSVKGVLREVADWSFFAQTLGCILPRGMVVECFFPSMSVNIS